ncbi:hypothetical protein HNO88_002938 [Novosphingobium chloroacetimidivorans]|uniref:Uncharacterized protein n=2 Tax=Novosphingobium chloroacetimidivorans TaxID=1428314 RepID=A0A7W7NXM1_9SPHN|nr:hypothetical protein [Novosphingobium chloroacetimidivorans]
MGRAENVINTGVTSKAAGTNKNDASAIDSDSYSLQKFFDMLMKGDTVATEILFAPVADADPRWSEVRTVGRQLLNRQCKGFVGYCVRQAAKYGIKGSRMSAVKALIDVLRLRQLQLGSPAAKLREIDYILQDFAERHEHAEWVNIPSPNGADLWHIRCCDRAMPITSSIGEATKVYEKVWENYGERARAAMSNEGIDWKAMSHAVRVARQAIELLNTGQITFPRPDAAELRAIKLGQRPYADVSQLLESLVEEVHLASAQSELPESSDPIIADSLVRREYRAQVCGS